MRLIWKVIGFICLGLALLGTVLPLLPTTPFLLLAAFAFERGSERFHNWLVNHARFGPPIAAWREHGAISAHAKRLALVAMAATVLITLALGVSPIILGVQVLVLLCVGVFIATRPLPPQQ